MDTLTIITDIVTSFLGCLLCLLFYLAHSIIYEKKYNQEFIHTTKSEYGSIDWEEVDWDNLSNTELAAMLINQTDTRSKRKPKDN